MSTTHHMRTIAWAMTAEAATLAAASTLHLTGAFSSGSSGAGIPEAVICVVLLAGAAALFRDPVRGRPVAQAALGFAIFGFVVGLTFTVPDGAAVDIAYHAVMLPILIATALWRRPGSSGREVSPGI